MRVLLTQEERERIRRALQRVAPGSEIEPAEWVEQHSQDVLSALEVLTATPWALQGVLSILKIRR